MCGPRTGFDAGGSRLIITSPDTVAKCGAGSPLLQVVFFSPLVSDVS